jgi:hypothetical protein
MIQDSVVLARAVYQGLAIPAKRIVAQPDRQKLLRANAHFQLPQAR